MSRIINKYGNPILVDAVITTFNERVEQINITLISCIKQSHAFNKIYLIDDGSISFCSSAIIQYPTIEIIQLPENLGISAARNIAIVNSSAEYIACINVEIEIEPDWVKTLLSNFCDCYEIPISAAFGKLILNNNSILANWRMRFQEQSYSANSGLAKFAPGHAVLFKKSFLDQVQGYSTIFKLVHEDADICFRLQELGTAIYYNAYVSAKSHQTNSLELLSKKQLVRMTIGQVKNINKKKFLKILIRDHFNRFFRNFIKGRWSFLVIDWKVSFTCYKQFKN